MSLPETVSFDNTGHIERFSLFKKFFLALVIILVSLLSFGIGRLSVEEKREPVRIMSAEVGSMKQEVSTQVKPTINQTATVINNMSDGGVYASSKGVRYYYFHCKSTVSEKNKVTFATATMAEQAGYTLATNCKPR